jgi:L-alanine-DL-glutamate epimerase-like enolase superfamily enzyme
VSSRVILSVTQDTFATDGTFTISRGSRTAVHVVTVRLEKDGVVGQGECVPYARYGESVDSVCEQILSLKEDIEQGLDRLGLQNKLAPGAARNALDCAFWDLEAKLSGEPVWKLAGLDPVKTVITAFTLSLDTPEKMQMAAANNATRPLLKIKLGGGDADMERLRAVRAGAPNSQLIVDANEGWAAEDYDVLAPVMLELGVTLVEQPLPANADEPLQGRERPLPVCADEACHDRKSLASLKGKYDVINIKLDKTGGLTEALALKEAALQQGFGVMVGCMVGSSLAMAPALLVAQGVDFVDLDGPLLLAEDRDEPIVFEGSEMHPAPAALWG